MTGIPASLKPVSKKLPGLLLTTKGAVDSMQPPAPMRMSLWAQMLHSFNFAVDDRENIGNEFGRWMSGFIGHSCIYKCSIPFCLETMRC